jgi:hypothetical protein
LISAHHASKITSRFCDRRPHVQTARTDVQICIFSSDVIIIVSDVMMMYLSKLYT